MTAVIIDAIDTELMRKSCEMYNRFIPFVPNDGSDTPSRERGLEFAEAMESTKRSKSGSTDSTNQEDSMWHSKTNRVTKAAASFVTSVVQQPLFYEHGSLLGEYFMLDLDKSNI